MAKPGQPKPSQPGGDEPNQGELSPGAVVDAARNDSVLEETGREWGGLPQRDRKELNQGRKETFSPLYRDLTEKFYQRVAGEDQ